MNKILLAVSLLFLMLTGAAPAQAVDAGHVIFAKGQVTAERNPAVALNKGDAVVVGDTIATGEKSRAQLLMLDGAKLALRPASRLRIEEFAYSGSDPADGQAVISSDDERSVSSLLKGGFRTITGAIGKDNEASYEVRTAVGVLGIRGTDYTVVFCNADCAPDANGTPVEDGLYLGVTEGRIAFRTSTQTIELGAGEFAFIPLHDGVLRRLSNPPTLFNDVDDLRSDDGAGFSDKQNGFNAGLATRRAPQPGTPASTEGDQTDPNGETAPAQSINATSPDGQQIDITGGGADPTGNRSISWSTGPLGRGFPGTSGAVENTPAQYLLSNGFELQGFAAAFPGSNSPGPATFELGSSANVDNGFDSLTVMRWGRWSGGTAAVTASDGSDLSVDLGTQSLHWIMSPEGNAPVMPITGVANYTVIGNTSPTDNLGNIGILGSATFLADFTQQAVSSTLSIDINNQNWTATGNGAIGASSDPPLAAHLFHGLYNTVIVDGVTGGFGEFSGFFSGPGDSSDPAFPGGVGLTYTLQDQGGATEVSGAIAFGNP